ncbi:MAG: IS200/IS605 family transposase [Blastocatellia bacterium]
MTKAIVRKVNPAINNCELTHLTRIPIDLELATLQHKQYEQCLMDLGCQVNSLPYELDLPGSVFVEHTAIVFDELAIITRPGAGSRRKETISIAQALSPYRQLHYIKELATILVIKGHVAKDHVPLMVSIPPQVTISNLVQTLKGKSAYKLLGEFEKLRWQYWGGHLWARGYFCRSSGNVTDEIIKQYISNQLHEDDEDFRVDGEISS